MSVTLSQSIDVSYAAETLTFVVSRAGAELATAAATVSALASGLRVATASADLSALSAGKATLDLINASANVRGSQVIYIDGDGNLVEGQIDTRDLEPTQWTLALSRGDDGVLYADRPVRCSPGNEVSVGLACRLSRILPGSAVLATMTSPTCDDAGGKVTVAKRGIDPSFAKVTVTTASDASAANNCWVRTTVTNNQGDGPVTIQFEVEVIADAS